MNFEWIKKLFDFIKPPQEWKVVVILVMGFLIGLVLFTLHISKATSYLSDDPKTCVNCHVMNTAYATWERSSHARVAKCTDCHVPHDNIVKKYLFKAKDGVRHSYVFTAKKEPQVIRMHEEGQRVVQNNCIRCHFNLIDQVSAHKVTYDKHLEGAGPLCWDCHRETPHGKVRSLSATPSIELAKPAEIIPSWFEKTYLNSKNDNEENK